MNITDQEQNKKNRPVDQADIMQRADNAEFRGFFSLLFHTDNPTLFCFCIRAAEADNGAPVSNGIVSQTGYQ